MKIKNRLLSGLLSFVMILSLLPAMSFVTDTEVQAETTKNPEIYVYPEKSLSEKGYQEVGKATASFYTGIWHYSGSTWGTSDGKQKVSDSKFKKTAGNVANPEDVFKYFYPNGVQTFEYSISGESEIGKALNSGDDIHVEISPVTYGNPEVTMKTLFNFPTEEDDVNNLQIKTNLDGTIKGYDSKGNEIDAIAKLKKGTNNDWIIVFTLPLRFNFYDEQKFSFNDLNTGVQKFIPVPKLGFGYIMYSMFPKNTAYFPDSKANNASAIMWIGDKSKTGAYMDWMKDNAESLKPIGEIAPYDIYLNGNDGYIKDDKSVYLYNTIDGLRNSSSMKIGDGTFKYAGAVSDYFRYGLNLTVYSKSKVKIIGSYVKIADIKKDGTIIYEKVCDSTYIPTIFNAEGNVMIPPRAFVADSNNSSVIYKGVANDVITSPIDLGSPKDISWVGKAPETSKNKIEISTKDIDYFAFGVITNDTNVIDELYRIYTSTEYSDEARALAMVFLEKWFSNLSLSDIQSKEFMDNSTYKLILDTLTAKRQVNKDGIVSVDNVAVELSDISYVPTGRPDIKGLGTDNISATNKKASLSTASVVKEIDLNTVYIRYIVAPVTTQQNRLLIYEDNVLKETIVYDPIAAPVVANDGVYNDIRFSLLDVPDAELVKWTTSNIPPTDFSKGELPKGSQDGVVNPDIIYKVPVTENVYAEWKIESWTDETLKPIEYDVPQWRLSLYNTEYAEWRKATMNLIFSADEANSCQTSYIESEVTESNYIDYIFRGEDGYNVKNPNGQIALVNVNPDNMRWDENSWIHSKATSKGDYILEHDNKYQRVDVNASLNLVKTSEISGLTVATWLVNNSVTTTLNKYKINSGLLPLGYNGENIIPKKALAEYYLDNITTFVHYKATYEPGCRGHGEDDETCDNPHCACNCRLIREVTTVKYTPAKYQIDAIFRRYIQQNTDAKKLVVQPEVKSDNAKTTIKYQLNNVLNIYPEYGMLFANDNPDDANQESIKWVVGDQARKVSPVIYQTLQHKVFVSPISSGVNVTDSRGITNANKIGEGNKPMFYKGSSVNTTFRVYRDEKNSNVGLLTAKTYALDFNETANVKSAWGNSNYNSLDSHTALLNAIKGDNNAQAKSIEKLLIDSPAYNSLDYNGAEKSQQTSSYKKVLYSGKDVTTFTHELIVRGGAVIGVYVESRDNLGKKTLLTMPELKTFDESLYEAILAMNLYNEENDRSKTIFSTFEHLTGDKLTEGSYANMLASARQKIDTRNEKSLTTPTTSSVSEDKGWYSEDTTVLVIKEYVTNYEVPSISYGDKISLSVKGLETPIDKSSFFKDLGKGYTYLKYDLSISIKNANANTIPTTNAYFEFSSFPGDALSNGEQKVNYLVPNVSVTDSTSLH